MSDWLKLVQCKHTPTQLFTIFDYTKLVYVIDGSFYLKQIVTPQQKPTFIDIKHDFDKIIAIHATLDNIVTIQVKGQSYFACFYASKSDQITIRIPIHLQGSNFGFKSICSENILMICCTTSDLVSHQIFFVDCVQKIIIARGFTEGQIFDIALGPNCSLSLLTNKHVIAYKNEPMIDKDTTVRIYKEAEADINMDFQKHFWIEDQLLVWGKNKAYLIIKNKVCQQFTDFHRLHNAASLVCGFLACDGCVIKIYKKKNIRYELICEIIDENLMECKNITLSPQEDIFAYFTPVIQTLVVSTTFSQQIQEALSRQNPLELAQTLKSKAVSHQKSYDYTLYSSTQSWFAAVYGTQIKLINSHNYQKFITIELANEGQNTFASSDLKARHLVIHPNRPIFAVALRKCIRVYYVTFNQVKILKQIQISMCGYLIFNHSGSILTAVVAGKGGAKLYIYKINQFKSQLILLETITIGKKPISVCWDSLDTCLYCFYVGGYFTFTLQSRFKNRKQITLELNFQATGAVLSKQDEPIIFGGQTIVSIVDNIPNQIQTIKQTQIKQIFIEGQYYFIIFENGKIGRCKTLDIDSCYIKSFDLGTKGKKFQIRLQQDSKFLYLSQDLNAKFYEFGTSYNGFTDIIGVEKKKLYAIMEKHKYYQEQIKKIKQQFATVLLQFKAKAAAEQKKIESQYNFELKDHVQRQKKVKQEKAKLQEMMQINIDIKEKESMKQIKQLERLYERKIALTTNKLLTEKEIGFRDRLTAENNLKGLQDRFEQEVEQIRNKFASDLKHQILDKNQSQRQLTQIKKHYQTRLYQLQQQNQILLKNLQQKNQSSLINLKKMVNNWQNKYSECISQKDNIQKQYNQQILNNQILRQKIIFLDTRRIQSERRCQNLSDQIVKIQRVLEDRNKILQFYEKRIEDLEKSNQIMKYRVLEVKEQNDPYQSQIQKLKQNLTDLQQEYDKILKSSHDQEQKMQIYKKQKIKLKQDVQILTQKYTKLSKRHQELLDKVRETTKSPIQQIRKQLLIILDSYARVTKSYSNIQKRADSPLGELNRIRDHLQVCLDQAVTTNKKNDQQRKIQVTKKNRENSQLLIQINTMRKKIRELQDQIKQKNLQISRLIRGETPTISGKQQKQRDRVETTQAQSKDFMKTKSRQTFYERSMFRSGNHWNKRLKTEEGGRRKKSSLSMMRDRQNNSLAIHPQSEQIDEYKRIIEQKDIFIQKLIAKIQKS